MQTMNFEGPGFRLQVPTTWLITSTPSVQVMFISPPRRFGRANLSITIRPLEKDATLEEVVQTAQEIQQKEFDSFELLEANEYQSNGLVGYKRVYKWFSKEHNFPVQQCQIMLIVNQILYTLTCTRPDVESMAEFDEIFEQMVKSFQLTEWK